MPGKNTHITAGVVSAVPAIVLCKKAAGRALSPITAAGILAASVAGSTLPDRLEPADCPNHRGFLHSVVAGTVAFLLVPECLNAIRSIAESETEALFYNSREEECKREILLSFLCFITASLFGFLSHQILDVFTPAGLPVLGK